MLGRVGLAAAHDPGEGHRPQDSSIAPRGALLQSTHRRARPRPGLLARARGALAVGAGSGRRSSALEPPADTPPRCACGFRHPRAPTGRWASATTYLDGVRAPSTTSPARCSLLDAFKFGQLTPLARVRDGSTVARGVREAFAAARAGQGRAGAAGPAHPRSACCSSDAAGAASRLILPLPGAALDPPGRPDAHAARRRALLASWRASEEGLELFFEDFAGGAGGGSDDAGPRSLDELAAGIAEPQAPRRPARDLRLQGARARGATPPHLLLRGSSRFRCGSPGADARPEGGDSPPLTPERPARGA